MKLLSTVSWSALSTTLKLATGFISIKVVAILIGAKGVAMIGQFQNFTNILMTISLAGITSGLIKYTSEFKDDQIELNKIWSTITKISSIILVVVVIILLIFYKYIAVKLLGNEHFGSIFIFLAFALITYVGNNLLLNILNGLHNIKKYTYINMLQAVCGVLITILLSYYLGVYGAILALVLNQSVVLVLSVIFVKSEDWFRLKNFIGKFDKGYFKKLSGFTLMSITSMCVVPTGQIVVRSYLARHTSWQIAGCWQGLQSLSNAYLQIVYLSLGTYYLPKLADISDKKLVNKEILNGYKLIMPFVFISSLLIYLFRSFIIKILFAKSFGDMSGMFGWQFIGDFFKIASWIMAYLMLARAKTKIFVITEVIFGISFVLLSIICINLFGNNGTVIAFAGNYFLYFILFLFLYKKGYLI